MKKFSRKVQEILNNKTLMKKIYRTIGILAIYRLLIFIPVPFVDLQTLMSQTIEAGAAGGFGYLIMLMGGALSNFAIIGIGVSPYITSSIILQLLSSVIPHLEQLTEQGEVGQAKINQYTRYLTFPMAFLQGLGMVFIMNSMLGGTAIDTGNIGIVVLTAFILSVGSMLLMWLGEIITEKGISNGISMLIFASIVSGIVQSAYTSLTAGSSRRKILIFMVLIVLVLILLSIAILKSTKEIPVIYARSGKVQQSSILPIPLNPVGMVPIIFAMAFVSFPYLISQLITQFQPANEKLMAMANRVRVHLNIYSQTPGWLAIILYVIFIVAFTFLYTLITFSPDRISDNIQKRGGFVPGIRPGRATAKYINGILMHLCLRGGLGLALVGIYSYLLNMFPFISSIAQSVGGLPIIVTGSGIIIIVGVVQDMLNKVDTELVMAKYEQY
jgi:preprotein translocase subunit SecY